MKRLLIASLGAIAVLLPSCLLVYWMWRRKEDAGAIATVLVGIMAFSAVCHAWRVGWCGDKPAKWFAAWLAILGFD